VKHILSVDRPICGLETPVSMTGTSVRIIFGSVDCADCLRRGIAEAEERARVLRDLLAQVEALS